MAEYDYQRVERLEADLDKLVKGLEEEVERLRKAERDAAEKGHALLGRGLFGENADRLQALLDSIRKEGGNG